MDTTTIDQKVGSAIAAVGVVSVTLLRLGKQLALPRLSGFERMRGTQLAQESYVTKRTALLQMWGQTTQGGVNDVGKHV